MEHQLDKKIWAPRVTSCTAGSSAPGLKKESDGPLSPNPLRSPLPSRVWELHRVRVLPPDQIDRNQF
ncbi:kinesin-like protein KIF2C-like protein [Corchorus capsularis]|uniref:Kinesin-like protein KIF2C-like protein n=1 Tax=Corchorus capsularis TaxID=210143 RepID=A0A1R3IW89_COCAP|nr:kinesin-like protein KIF2C-like protein [Corchorus capsularis]